MQHGHRPASAEQVPATLVPESGWHFLHVFYRVDRAALADLSDEARREGRRQVLEALDRDRPGRPEQLQASPSPATRPTSAS